MNNPAKGYEFVIGIGLESTPGVAVPPTEWIEVVSEGMVREPDVQDHTGLSGSRGTSKTSRVTGSIPIGGPITFNARKNIIGNFLYWAMGGGNGGAPSLDSEALPSLTVVVDKKVRKNTFAGCKIGSLALTSEVNGPLVVVPTFVGMNFTDATGGVTSPSYDDQVTYKILMHHGLTLTVDASEIELHSWGLTINNNVADDHFANSQYRTMIPEQRRTIELAMNVDWDELTQVTRGLWTKFLSGDTAALIATFSDGANSVAFSTPYVTIGGDPAAADGPDYVRTDITAVADDSGPGQNDALAITLA